MLALREHSRAELERKLVLRLTRAAAQQAGASVAPGSTAENSVETEGDPQAEAQALHVQIAQVLDALEASGLLDESRAAQALVQAKAARYGVRRLQRMLQARALDTEATHAALLEARSTEFERAHAIWQRRFGSPAVDLRERARQHRFLAARGFGSDVIDRVLKGEDPGEGTCR